MHGAGYVGAIVRQVGVRAAQAIVGQVGRVGRVSVEPYFLKSYLADCEIVERLHIK